jgi:predicted MFS family arabinose efflux permease
MSISVTADTARRTIGAPRRNRLVSLPLALVFLSSAATLTSFYLLLSVTPMLAAASGASGAGAGLVTGLPMLASVLAEGAAPALMARLGGRGVLAAGGVLLGVPALGLLWSGSLGALLAVGLIRGLGFGFSVVVTGALVAELVPADRRGEGTGLAGLVSCGPAVLALPSGVWLAQHYGYGLVTLAAAAAALAPLVVLAGLPGRTRRADRTRRAGSDRHQAAPAPVQDGAPLTLRDGLRQPALRRTSLIFAATTVSAGVVVAFLPLASGASGQSAAAGLFAQAVTAALGRWWGGRLGDRRGHASLLIPGLLLSVAGMALVAAAGLTSTGAWLPITAMAIFGTGFGVIQNATFAMMIGCVPASGYGAASALWNLAYDAGYGAGPAVLGLLAARAGYGAAFAATVVIMLGAVRPSWRERRASRSARAGRRTR